MNTTNMPTRIICATSWNGNEFIYNVRKDTWEMVDDVRIGADHDATSDDLPDAENCRLAEDCPFSAAIRIEEYDTNTL